MKERVFAVLRESAEMDGNAAHTAEVLGRFGRVDVYSRSPAEGEIAIPPEASTEPKARNWVNARYEAAGFGGFLHVVKDDVEVYGDPSAFLADVENMIETLDYGAWLNTACDGMNYVYAKYNPTMTVRMDVPGVADRSGLKCDVCVATHSNVQWVCYDYRQVAGTDLLRFDEDFTVPMFFIIEFLARRRATKRAGSLYFMNQYLTVSTERGVFRNKDKKSSSPTAREVMAKEEAAFKSKDVRHEPDYNIDAVLEAFWEKLKSKFPPEEA